MASAVCSFFEILRFNLRRPEFYFLPSHDLNLSGNEIGDFRGKVKWFDPSGVLFSSGQSGIRIEVSLGSVRVGNSEVVSYTVPKNSGLFLSFPGTENWSYQATASLLMDAGNCLSFWESYANGWKRVFLTGTNLWNSRVSSSVKSEFCGSTADRSRVYLCLRTVLPQLLVQLVRFAMIAIFEVSNPSVLGIGDH